jgi:hypothetical protein
MEIMPDTLIFLILFFHILKMFWLHRARIFKLLRSPIIDSIESIPPILFLASINSLKFQHWLVVHLLTEEQPDSRGRPVQPVIQKGINLSANTVKKKLLFFLSQAWMSLTKLSLAGNN